MFTELLQGSYMVACLFLAIVVITRTSRNALSCNVICIVLLAAIHLAEHEIPMSDLVFAALELTWYGIVFAWCSLALQTKPSAPEKPQPTIIYRLVPYNPSEEEIDDYSAHDNTTYPH